MDPFSRTRGGAVRRRRASHQGCPRICVVRTRALQHATDLTAADIPREHTRHSFGAGSKTQFASPLIRRVRRPRRRSGYRKAFRSALRRHPRRYVAALPADETGWLAGARDTDVGKALALLHGKTSITWTLGELAEGVGVSRTVLAERFREFVGETPMAYLTRWRLQLARKCL